MDNNNVPIKAVYTHSPTVTLIISNNNTFNGWEIDVLSPLTNDIICSKDAMKLLDIAIEIWIYIIKFISRPHLKSQGRRQLCVAENSQRLLA